jgi:cell division protein FtsL
MSTRIAEDKIFERKEYPLLYLVKQREDTGPGKIIHSRSGIFYVLVIIVIFFSMGMLLNLGLKIQTINHDRKILKINEMIAIERERADRLQLKMSELKSPLRIIKAAEEDLGMHMSNDIKIMKINTERTGQEDIVEDYIAKSYSSTEISNYDNFLGTIYDIKDIVMVVSEGVLTFFIP